MMGGFLAALFGALASVTKIEHPTPLMYFLGFSGGALVAELALFGAVGSELGFGKAFALMAAKFLSPEGWGPLLFGGVVGTSIFWFPGDKGR